MDEYDDRARLRAVAIALGELAPRVVFVGGTVTALLITDPAAPPTRRTDDVDAIINVADQVGYHAIERRLRQLGFEQRPDEPVVCRWFHGDLIVDIMPKNEAVLGFSNRWYDGVFQNAVTLDLEGVAVRLVDAVWFLATKLEAFKGRGDGDFQGSRDIEDIIAVLDGRASIADEVVRASNDVREYLRTELEYLSTCDDFLVSIAGHLAGDTVTCRGSADHPEREVCAPS